jgi:metallothionein
MMGSYQSGQLLTCTHDDCGCRMRVEVQCDCPDAGNAYRCTCGAEMVAVDEPTTTKGPAR